MIKKCGFVAIVGRPNVGKSTLLNALLAKPMAPVSNKPHTTVAALRGVLTHEDAQLIFVDTPGLDRATNARTMAAAARDAAEGADVILFLLEAKPRLNPADQTLLKQMLELEKPLVVGITKMDSIKPKTAVLPVMEDIQNLGKVNAIVPLCAPENDGVAEVLKIITGFMPASPPLFPSDMLTDQDLQTTLADITRATAMNKLKQELPYSVQVETTGMAEDSEKVLEVHQKLIVERDGHKKIVIGKAGVVLKNIGAYARKTMKPVLGRPLRLFLTVSVKK